MRLVPLGPTDHRVPNVVAGMMRIEEMSDAATRELYDACRAAGVDFFDHADLYGSSRHGCERRFAEALNLSSAERDEITLHPAHMQVVLGTTNPQRVADAAAGSDIPLTRAEWYSLISAAGHKVP
ncbi:hypothetical protein [Microbacterium sp. NPDC080220]|uniref:hypothetical protein n=1 Tax=Microbacterium sp. NPDC080220 TaxID=3161017 RepID=UPI00343BA4E9